MGIRHSIQFENYSLGTLEHKKPQGYLCGGAFTYLHKVLEQKVASVFKKILILQGIQSLGQTCWLSSPGA